MRLMAQGITINPRQEAIRDSVNEHARRLALVVQLDEETARWHLWHLINELRKAGVIRSD